MLGDRHMMVLKCDPIDNEAVLKGFDCGNTSVNAMIAASYYPNLLKQSCTYMVSANNRLIGFYRLSIIALTLDDENAGGIGSYYWQTPSFSAVCLDYVAVDKRIHGHGLGTKILRLVKEQANRLSNEWPVRLLVLEALSAKYEWYRKRGFAPIDAEDLSKNDETIRLYIDLLSPEDHSLLNEYIENHSED